MKIYYQWSPWSYMYVASKEVLKNLNTPIDDIVWKPEFKDVWEEINKWWIAVLAIENSYMGNIHTNLYNFLKYDVKIIWEYYLNINHCICSKEKDIKNIKEVYSQIPALEQCHNYLKDKNITPKEFLDTALSAKYVSESNQKGIWAIASTQAAKLYNLNILDENIQDQVWNTTRFAVIVKNDLDVGYNIKSGKISILFEAKNIPSSLYKCLWAFATNNVNLTKIESMPSLKSHFSYMFYLELEWQKSDKNIISAFEELEFFTSFYKILGEY